jgi:uncharacterized RDD family membrane protein YckC
MGLPAAGAAGPLVYGGFWLRFVAMIVDGMVLGIVLGPLAFIGVVLLPTFLPRSDMMLLAVLAGFLTYVVMAVIAWVYFAKSESGAKMSTIGKRAFGLQVTDLNGQRVSFGRATGRFFGKILSGFFFIGYIMAAFTARKQGLHDLLAGCLVIRRR